MADLGEPPLHLFWVKNMTSQKEEKLTGQAKQNNSPSPSPPPSMLAQGLDNENTFIFKTQTPYFAISEYMDFHTENSDTSIFLRFMNSLT